MTRPDPECVRWVHDLHASWEKQRREAGISWEEWVDRRSRSTARETLQRLGLKHARFVTAAEVARKKTEKPA